MFSFLFRTADLWLLFNPMVDVRDYLNICLWLQLGYFPELLKKTVKYEIIHFLSSSHTFFYRLIER